jgi:hypothetical protein
LAWSSLLFLAQGNFPLTLNAEERWRQLINNTST